ncbi:MAG: hypothetical protein ACKO24_11110 [Leptolyngbyaceae cyanobacterium]
MLSYDKIQNKPRILHCLTGLTSTEFEALLPSFEAAWQTFIEAHFIQQARNRRYGGGRLLD